MLKPGTKRGTCQKSIHGDEESFDSPDSDTSAEKKFGRSTIALPKCGTSVEFPGRQIRVETTTSFKEFEGDQTKFLRTAQTAACVRSETPSLRRICCTCSLTVS